MNYYLNLNSEESMPKKMQQVFGKEGGGHKT